MSDWTMRGSRAMTIVGLAAALTLSACDKGKAPGEAGADKPAATSDSTKPAASSSAGQAASASAPAAATSTLELTGSYTSAVAEVRTPKDAPVFKNDTTAALGAGTLSLTLMGDGGTVLGKASGVLGNQRLSGTLDEGTLNGTLAPIDPAAPAFWGTFTATVTGAGAARTAKGSLRVADKEGRIVRASEFELKPAK